ncbi:hypothetical protein LOK49_LG01G03164 [Camellia lanceoleosa]|uniref:Uncharacterized protein n=1 Tax=Camellia lanceoleosa TaxID=1840588 RepID=A0ACC0J3P5_9ERIC|nr:hypothetical protein LOK49_LG01G03164 [Camellia lanceoleosa]
MLSRNVQKIQCLESTSGSIFITRAFQKPSGYFSPSGAPLHSQTMFLLEDNLSMVISTEEFKIFHEMDKRLYTILTKDLWRDPLESMRIIALWLWLERSSFKNIISKILSLTQFLINELADEAVTCLNCLNANPFLSFYEAIHIPLTQNLMDNEISLKYFHENRVTAIQGISKVISDVGASALIDLMQQAIEQNLAKMLVPSLVQPRLCSLRGLVVLR